jgi:hypothetical protein
MPDLKKANWENGFYWEGRNGYPLQPGLFDWECQNYIVVLSGNLITQKQLVTQYNLMGSNGKPIRTYLVSSVVAIDIDNDTPANKTAISFAS